MLKKLMLLVAALAGSLPQVIAASCWPCTPEKCAPWDKLACILAGAVFIALVIAVYAGLLVLLNAVAPKFTARCAKSISGHTLRNFIVGLVILIAWLTAAHLYKGCELAARSILFWGAGLIWSVKMFAAPAMCGLIGARALALRGGRKQTDAVKNVVTGLALITLASFTIIPGILVLLVLSCVELGATLCVALKMK